MLGIGIIGHGGVGKTVSAKFMYSRFIKKEYLTEYYHLLHPFLSCLRYMDISDMSLAKNLEDELLKHVGVESLLYPYEKFVYDRDPYIMLVDGIHSPEVYKLLRNQGFYFLRIDPGVKPPTSKVAGLSFMKATFSIINDGSLSNLYTKLEIMLHRFLIKHGCD